MVIEQKLRSGRPTCSEQKDNDKMVIEQKLRSGRPTCSEQKTTTKWLLNKNYGRAEQRIELVLESVLLSSSYRRSFLCWRHSSSITGSQSRSDDPCRSPEMGSNATTNIRQGRVNRWITSSPLVDFEKQQVGQNYLSQQHWTSDYK